MRDLNYWRCMGQSARPGQFSCYPARAFGSSSEHQIIISRGKDWTRAEMPSSSIMADLSSEASTSGSVSYIDHTVTRLDTLAGVAIKYGVEVTMLALLLWRVVTQLDVLGSVVSWDGLCAAAPLLLYYGSVCCISVVKTAMFCVLC